MRLSRTEVLDKHEIQSIHKTSFKILTEIGILVESDKARTLLEKNGSEVDNNSGLVKYPASLITESIKAIPKSFALYGPDGTYKVDISTDSTVFATQGSPTRVYDENAPNNQRDGILTDFIKFVKVIDDLENISCLHLEVWPVDISQSSLHCHVLREWYKHSHKPFGLGCRNGEISQDLMNMLSTIVGDSDDLIEFPRITAYYNPTSPLLLTRDLTEGLFIFAKYKQPIIIAPAATAGLTAPITLAGLLAQTNAEILATIVIAQLTNPGAPVLYGAVNSPLDPNTLNVAWGAIESGLITAGAAQLARFYKIPSRATGCMTNAPLLDIQNGIERFMTLSLAVTAGINYVTCAGTFESGKATSLELLVIDNELISILKRGLRGISVTANALALEEIRSIMANRSKTSFIHLKHTNQNLRKELFFPKLAIRAQRASWINEGLPDIIQNAQTKISSILGKTTEKVRPLEVTEWLDDYITKVELRS